MASVAERAGAVTRGGEPITLLGRALKVGDTAPDAVLVDTDMSAVQLSEVASGVRILSLVPSLDTGVCYAETKRFDQEVGDIDGVSMLTVSVDLPFAQKRYAEAEDVTHPLLSAYRNPQFGVDYGATMQDWRLLHRTVMVLDRDNVIRYIEYVPEVTTHPNYEAALAAARKVAAEA